MKALIYDMEVFKFDTLFGSKIINEDGSIYTYQTWNLEDIRDFYKNHNKEYCWVGHNILNYDNLILEAILNHKNPYDKSKLIIGSKVSHFSNLDLVCYDLMEKGSYYSLKATEAVVGKNISESEVDFDLDRPLTEEEKKLTEKYNNDDLQQTLENFLDKDNFGRFRVKLDFVKTFGLNYKALNYTGTKLSELVLQAKSIDGIEKMYVPPKMYDTLILENKDLIDFYLREGFRKNEKLLVKIGNAELNIGSGGVHSAIKKYYTKKALYFDVSGYYNLTMINYDLIPRTLGEYGKNLYVEMYHKQLEYKKTDPEKRACLKIVLLSVFGAEMCEFSQLYDPQRGTMVTITGQLFLCDLLEKLQDKVNIVQTNTDGIIVEPNDWNNEEEIIKIVEEWENRTGYTIKKDHIFELYQRDVNNYMYKDDKGNIHTKGEALKQYEANGRLFYGSKPNVDFKEPAIISKCIVEFLMNNRFPEEVVKESERDLRLFQYICKQNSFDYTEYEKFDKINNVVTTTRLQGINRAFALKSDEFIGMIYKHKDAKGKHSKAKISNLPESVFVYDNEILSEDAIDKLVPMIDYQYYVDRSYERIAEFVELGE